MLVSFQTTFVLFQIRICRKNIVILWRDLNHRVIQQLKHKYYRQAGINGSTGTYREDWYSELAIVAAVRNYDARVSSVDAF